MQEKMVDAQLALFPLHAGSQTMHNAKYAVLSQALSLYRGPVCQCLLCMNTMPNMQDAQMAL